VERKAQLPGGQATAAPLSDAELLGMGHDCPRNLADAGDGDQPARRPRRGPAQLNSYTYSNVERNGSPPHIASRSAPLHDGTHVRKSLPRASPDPGTASEMRGEANQQPRSTLRPSQHDGTRIGRG
jgi:hypothetical protein